MRRASAAALMLSAITVVHAMYMRVDLENVPIARLVANLERLISEKPDDAQLHLNLGRAHAMAWTQKTEETKIVKGEERRGPWFGYEPSAVPFTLVETADDAKLKAAAPHLREALREYGEAVRLAPQNVVALLGQAWLTEKSGDRAKAIELYRAVIERAWEIDSARKRVGMGGPVSAEAMNYLSPLLDPTRDAKELATLRDRQTQMDGWARVVTPLAVPLRDNLTIDDIVAPDARVTFDADGSGRRKSWSWITPNAGWLVYNQTKDPSITSALQLFGNVTFWLFWENGYDALCGLDDNGDGSLNGPELAHLSIWRDANSNGRTDGREVQPLHAWAISSLSCRHEIVEDDDVAAWSPRGVSFTGVGTRPTWDVLLHERK